MYRFTWLYRTRSLCKMHSIHEINEIHMTAPMTVAFLVLWIYLFCFFIFMSVCIICANICVDVKLYRTYHSYLSVWVTRTFWWIESVSLCQYGFWLQRLRLTNIRTALFSIFHFPFSIPPHFIWWCVPIHAIQNKFNGIPSCQFDCEILSPI